MSADTQRSGAWLSRQIIAELCRSGVDRFYVSPGYRNAPLIAALCEEDQVRVRSCPDERAAAFQALGYGRARGRPAVLLCTSGTAGANYLPAVIEASRDQVPMLIITADRPFDLVHTDANQVLPTQNFFGTWVRYSMTFPEHLEAEQAGAHWRYLLRCTVAPVAGPVHANIPLREPLEPPPVPLPARGEPAPVWIGPFDEDSQPEPSEHQLSTIRRALLQASRPLILWGGAVGAATAGRLEDLLRKGWPVRTDISCGTGLRHLAAPGDGGIAAVETQVRAYAPDFVLQAGRRPVSKAWSALLETLRPEHIVIINEFSGIAGGGAGTAVHVRCPADRFLARLLEEPLPDAPPAAADLLAGWGELRRQLASGVADLPFSFPWIAAQLDAALPADYQLLPGNSTSIRAFDSFTGYGPGPGHPVFANRGASGIEGLVSTAMGVADGCGRPVAVVPGDISLIHDLNALLQLTAMETPVLVVVVNDKGGGIFRRMPISAHPEVMNPLMSTPHNLNFAGIAAMASLPYEFADDRAGFLRGLRRLTAGGTSALLECCPGPADEQRAWGFLRGHTRES